MTLEIRVHEDIKVVDSLGEAIRIIVRAFKKWAKHEDIREFQIVIKKVSDRAPPALGINVSDTSKIVDRLV